MEFNYGCSICGRQTGRKENATRHLRLVHDGNGEVIDLSGQSRGTRIPAMLGKRQRLLKTIGLLHNEEYIREFARLRAREDYKHAGSIILLTEDNLLHTINRIESATSTKPISVSELIDELTGYDSYFEVSEKRKKVVREPTLKELVMGRDRYHDWR